MKINFFEIGVLITSLSLLTSCGGSNGSNSGRDRVVDEAQIEAERAAADGSNIQGRYIAKFVTLNSHVVGTIPGSAQFKRDDDKLSAYLRLFAGSPSIAHFQNVHMGNRCPTMADDTNGDGYLDYQEALKVVGSIIIPLDWDIGSQLSANNSWPKAFPNGSYEYLKIASFNRFWNDLKSTDRNPDDSIVKLATDEGLAITGKVVLIQGVEEIKNLPDTVAGYGRWKNFQTFPIACGVFKQSTEETGVIYEESIPGPVGPVVEGQDQPAPEGADEIPGTGTVITGPSNDAGSNDSEREDDNTSPTSTSNPRTPTTNGNETRPAPTPNPNPTPVPTPTPTPSPDTDEDDNSDEDDDNGICWPWERDCR